MYIKGRQGTHDVGTDHAVLEQKQACREIARYVGHSWMIEIFILCLRRAHLMVPLANGLERMTLIWMERECGIRTLGSKTSLL